MRDGDFVGISGRQGREHRTSAGVGGAVRCGACVGVRVIGRDRYLGRCRARLAREVEDVHEALPQVACRRVGMNVYG